MPISQGQPFQHAIGCGKGKEKVKVTEEDNDNEDKAMQKLWKKLENFVVSTTFSNKELAALLLLPIKYYEADVGLPQGAKILGRRKSELVLVAPAT
ncbi:hypothetical protein C0995_002877 [Termitomyces sp. Mi166|nr:hypothetical protein C0995_002877 [Termitomyces sp. Mi166\